MNGSFVALQRAGLCEGALAELALEGADSEVAPLVNQKIRAFIKNFAAVFE